MATMRKVGTDTTMTTASSGESTTITTSDTMSRAMLP